MSRVRCAGRGEGEDAAVVPRLRQASPLAAIARLPPRAPIDDDFDVVFSGKDSLSKFLKEA
jgi:hypothetical protein